MEFSKQGFRKEDIAKIICSPKSFLKDSRVEFRCFLEALVFDDENNVFEIIRNLRTSVWVRSQETTDLQPKEYLYDNLPLFLNLNNDNNALCIPVSESNLLRMIQHII